MSGVHASATAVLMDRVYRYQRHGYDLTRRYYLLGRDDLIEALRPPAGGSVLEIGCGTARNLIKAARRYPSANCYGVDISEAMLQTARSHVERAGLTDRIALAAGDAAEFDPVAVFGKAGFDRVFFSYSLSMIPMWRQALNAAADMAARGHGRLHVVDFGGLEGLPRLLRILLFRWLHAFHVEPRLDLGDALVAPADRNGGHLCSWPIRRGYGFAAELSFDGAGPVGPSQRAVLSRDGFL